MTKDTNCQGCSVQQGTHKPAEALRDIVDQKAQGLPKWVEALAESWDGCMYDAPGETIDIGASIRLAAKKANVSDMEATNLRELAECRTTVENMEAERRSIIAEKNDYKIALRAAREELAALKAAPAAQAVEPAAEKLGETCMDGGTCHHKESCTETGRCFRRECCAPLTMALDAGLTMQQWRYPPAPAAVAVPNGWREKFAAEVYANLAAADNQDIPLEDYPARILKVLDSIVGPRHPVVIQWRNDAIQNCIAISYKYCRDPESHKYLKQDLEALLAATPPAQAQDVQRDADMFWDSQDGERFGHDITSIIEECDDGAVVKIARAQSLPIITVRVIQTDDGCDYEVLDDAAIAASAAQGGA